MDSPFSTPTCPCCSFLSGALFLPWNEKDAVDEVGGINDGIKKNFSGDLSQSTDVITPNEAWQRIAAMGIHAEDTDDEARQRILLVDTHGHPHLQRDVQYAGKQDDTTTGPRDELIDSSQGVVSLTCAVSPLDWKDSLDYASQSPRILPALGVHPWYLSDIMVDISDTDISDENLEQYLKWEWLSDLEHNLSKHPHMLVGEIGLCKMARFVREFPKDRGGKATALQLQKMVFRKQLELAAKWSRPVTVHCVNAHGIFMEVMRNILVEAKESCKGEEIQEAKLLWRKAFPPAIAMHSFTGTAHHVGEILAFEKELLHPEDVESGGKRRRRKQKQHGVESPPIQTKTDKDKDDQKEVVFYFGFSHAVNHIMCTSEKARKKGMEAVRSIPPDRLLVESDVHASVDVTLGTAGAAAYAAQARGETLEEVAEHTTRNGLRFLSSLGLQ
eukprot:CAMPEP_0183715888 /NCGR_PEP_ID=MMETSP0737-20130205/9968_1 /TAXON_ID=385413 /ORGANISM="Thalassiosira miniscula, Strain CCMP1093" /LENGTH=442 /DNA_ID=CAMNT_0025945061 /DNA_START=210 /DNA_END=1538 /DNA_ORIENTATION=+